MKRPFQLWVLAFLLVWLSLGGFFGGVAMLLDSSGRALGMGNLLPRLPVTNFTLPGLFLFFIMGLCPLLLALGLLQVRALPRNALPLPSRHTCWQGSVALAGLLLAWLALQAFYIGFKEGIQYLTLVNAFLLLIFAFQPAVRAYCAAKG